MAERLRLKVNRERVQFSAFIFLLCLQDTLTHSNEAVAKASESLIDLAATDEPVKEGDFAKKQKRPAFYFTGRR